MRVSEGVIQSGGSPPLLSSLSSHQTQSNLREKKLKQFKDRSGSERFCRLFYALKRRTIREMKSFRNEEETLRWRWQTPQKEISSCLLMTGCDLKMSL